MDEAIFYCDVDNIKQRVASYGRPTPQAASEDMFSDDLAALKMRLHSMEASLNYLNASQGQREAQNVRPTAAQSACNLPSLPSTLPSGPLFWQLFTSLRTDVRGLDSRVADVEENLSNLEDRVDGLDPNRFTPSGSNATYTSMQCASDQTYSSAYQQAAELPCDYQQYSPAWQPRYASQTGSHFPNTLQYGAGAAGTDWAGTPGVAFRDREIARLEDILSRVESDLQESEELVNHKSSQIEQLNYQQDSLQHQIAQLHQTIRAYNNIFAMNRRGFESQQAEHLDDKAQLVAAKRQVQELQDILTREANSDQADIDDAVAEKEIELSRMREFADRKDDVVRQQGGIIARGATIIQERDDTIERLTRELKVSVDDGRNERRERERYSKLLEEKTEEIFQLKESIERSSRPETPTNTPGAISTPSTAQPETQDEVPSAPITPIPFGVPQDRRQLSGRWTPQSLGKYVRLPHEQQRAAAWENGSLALDRGKFGQAGKLSLRRSDSLKLLEKLALVEEGDRTSLLKSRKRSYKLPLDDFQTCKQESCETPPALPPRLSKSHHDDGAGHSNSTSKHLHVHPEKARRSFQAYVEAEDNREKRGDAA